MACTRWKQKFFVLEITDVHTQAKPIFVAHNFVFVGWVTAENSVCGESDFREKKRGKKELGWWHEIGLLKVKCQWMVNVDKKMEENVVCTAVLLCDPTEQDDNPPQCLLSLIVVSRKP